MRFHLIDRVERWEPGRSITALKLTSRSEDYWEPERGTLRVPPPFVFEALCQAGTWLIMITTERRKRAALLSVGRVEWHGAVYPGDVMEMSCEVDSWGDASAVISGRVSIDGRVVLTADEIMCALLDADKLADLDDTARLQRLLTREEVTA